MLYCTGSYSLQNTQRGRVLKSLPNSLLIFVNQKLLNTGCKYGGIPGWPWLSNTKARPIKMGDSTFEKKS